MDFYSELARYYDLVFPFEESIGNFLKKQLSSKTATGGKILDIACGTGTYTAYLAEDNIEITGLDFDSEMIRQANTGISKSNIEFIEGDMLNLQKDLEHRLFQGVYCIGNSIVHLPGEIEVALFLSQCRISMTVSGTLIIQTINFDRILDQDIRALPTLKNSEIEFERNYQPLDSNHVSFNTSINIRDNEKTFLNSIPLLTLRKDRMSELLECAGFKVSSSYGSYSEQEWSPESFLTILVCTAV